MKRKVKGVLIGLAIIVSAIVMFVIYGESNIVRTLTRIVGRETINTEADLSNMKIWSNSWAYTNYKNDHARLRGIVENEKRYLGYCFCIDGSFIVGNTGDGIEDSYDQYKYSNGQIRWLLDNIYLVQSNKDSEVNKETDDVLKELYENNFKYNIENENCINNYVGADDIYVGNQYAFWNYLYSETGRGKEGVPSEENDHFNYNNATNYYNALNSKSTDKSNYYSNGISKINTDTSKAEININNRKITGWTVLYRGQ